MENGRRTGSPSAIGRLKLGAWSPYLETLGALGVIVLINLLWFRDQWGFLETRPHPFWVVTVFIPIMYGLGPAVFSGLMSFGIHLLFQVTDSSFDFDPTPRVLMAAGALFIGVVRPRLETRVQTLRERNRSLETAVEDLATQFTQSEEARALLHRRMLGETFTFTNLYDVARRLETLEEGEIPGIAAEVTGKFLEATLVSVCFYDSGTLEVAAVYPPDAGSAATTDWLTSSAVLRECLGQTKTVSLRDVVLNTAPDQLSNAPLAIAAPLTGPREEVVGFILVEKIGFFQVTPTSVTPAATIARWTSQSLQASRRYQETRDRNIEDELTGAFGSTYTLKRLREEVERAKTFGFPLSVAVLEVARHDDVSADMMPNVLAVLGDVFRHNLGPTDLLGRHADGASFVIIFPHRHLNDADEVIDGLSREIEAFGFKPYVDDEPLRLTYRVSELSDGAQSPENLIGAE